MYSYNIWLEIELEIINQVELNMELEVDNSINLEIEMETCYQSGSGGLPYYEGPYKAIPKVIQQTLNTKNKSMALNVTIQSIPYSEVSNPEGGKTIIIGGEL